MHHSCSKSQAGWLLAFGCALIYLLAIGPEQHRQAPRLAVVLQGPVYRQAASVAWDQVDAIKVLSVWTEPTLTEIATPYIRAGFQLVASNLTAYMERRHTGQNSVNLQIATTLAGCLAAKQRGATHVVKLRSDLAIHDAEFFFGHVLRWHQPRLSFLGWWTGTPRYPCDYMFAGPVDELIGWLSSAYQQPGDPRFPELFLMDSYCAYKGWTADDCHLRFCRSVDWLIYRLPAHLLVFCRRDTFACEDVAKVAPAVTRNQTLYCTLLD